MNIYHHIPRRLTALLLVAAIMLSLVPSAFAGQQNSYHDPAEHWKEANNRTNELDANAVVTVETFTCGECGKATAFEVLRTPEYTRDGQTAMSRNVRYSDGTLIGGEGTGAILDGVPGQDALYRLPLDKGGVPNLWRPQHQHGQVGLLLSPQRLLDL